MMTKHPKITSVHLARKAIVYLRQSSLRQVHENLESQRLQYAMKERAIALGFQNIEIIDCDLGASASVGAKTREGFKQLLASVTLGEVGIVLSREASRLSRTDKDWCHLLELCQMFDTLIGDADQIYDLSTMDDQLVLGIKGTLSVVELKVLKSRLIHGQEEKARRGELHRVLAPGYVCDDDNKVFKDPNQRIQTAIALIFSKFRELWSARQTHKWFQDNDIQLPVNQKGGGKSAIVWQLPSHSFIRYVLHNPMYAGAYVYGRFHMKKIISGGQIIKRQDRTKKADEARVFIREHHEGYISWETFEENQKLLRSNATKFGSDESVSAVRKGHGLLAGLLRCGRCGRKFHVRYWGKSGTAARYLCGGDFQLGGQYCFGFGGATVDRRFSEILLEVISPLGIQASILATRAHDSQADGKHGALLKQVQQVEYEVSRAFEQYNATDPKNRLVAAELERRWNKKLEELDLVRKALYEVDSTKRTLTTQEEQQIILLGENFEHVWHSERCPIELKKKIARTLVEEVIVSLDESLQELRFVIHWKGGCHTDFKMIKPRSGAGRKTNLDDVELIKKMAGRYDDGEIARVLNKLKRKTGKGLSWNQTRVASVRKTHGFTDLNHCEKRGSDIFSLAQATTYCKVSDTAIRKLVVAGLLKMNQAAPWAPWEIQCADLDAEPVRSILDHLRKTGKLILKGTISENQQSLFQ
jgi:DNA invertase Pin-like site-specific DNA recombinase